MDDYQGKNSGQKLSAPPVEKKVVFDIIPKILGVINDYPQLVDN